MSEKTKPESIAFADAHRQEVVQNFVAGFINGDITIDLTRATVPKFPEKTGWLDETIVFGVWTEGKYGEEKRKAQRAVELESKYREKDLRFQNFENLITVYAGGANATDDERLDAEKELYRMIVIFRVENRIKGTLRASTPIEALESKLKQLIDQWIDETQSRIEDLERRVQP